MRAALGAVLITVLAGAGCGAPQSSSEDDLADSIRTFNDGVRWERFSAAAVAIPPPQRAQFVDEMDQRATDLKVTDYDIVRVDPHGKTEARVQIKLTWYKIAEETVHETHAQQTWEKHGKTWWMVDEKRLRGPEMPGLAEPVEPAAPDAPTGGSHEPSKPDVSKVAPVPVRAAKRESPCETPCSESVMKD